KAAAFARTPGVSWEMLPTETHNDPEVWRSLLLAGNVPLGALVRQLPRLTRLGLTNDPTVRDLVVNTLTDGDYIAKSRLHPMSLLVALRTYAKGANEHGSVWTPNRHVINALDEAFYKAFRNVRPTGKRILQAIDVSGSMSWSGNRSPSGLLPREVAGAMAMVTLGTERDADVVAFTSGRGGWGNPWAGGAHGVAPIPDLSPRQRLDDALATIDRMPMGGTDCAAPMLYALDKGLEYDAFVIYTDNETWAGQIHPHQALKLYRER